MALLVSLLLIIITESQGIISVYASPVTIFSTRGHFDTMTGQENTGHRLPTAETYLENLTNDVQEKLPYMFTEFELVVKAQLNKFKEWIYH